VIDWQRIKNFGNTTRHSFEIWLRTASGSAGTGPSSEEISIDYGSGVDAGNAGSGDPDSGQNWGAENRDGSSGANAAAAPASPSSYRVLTSPPIAGGSVSFGFDISSKAGNDTYHSDATMTSDVTPGNTVVGQAITVTGAPGK